MWNDKESRDVNTTAQCIIKFPQIKPCGPNFQENYKLIPSGQYGKYDIHSVFKGDLKRPKCLLFPTAELIVIEITIDSMIQTMLSGYRFGLFEKKASDGCVCPNRKTEKSYCDGYSEFSKNVPDIVSASITVTKKVKIEKDAC